jgi:hypothetical protein
VPRVCGGTGPGRVRCCAMADKTSVYATHSPTPLPAPLVALQPTRTLRVWLRALQRLVLLTSPVRARVCRLCTLLGVGRMNATVLDGAYRIPERRGSRSQGEGARHAAYGRTGRDVDGGRHGHAHLDGTLLQGSPASFGGVGADDSTVRSRESTGHRTCFAELPYYACVD